MPMPRKTYLKSKKPTTNMDDLINRKVNQNPDKNLSTVHYASYLGYNMFNLISLTQKNACNRMHKLKLPYSVPMHLK